MSTTDYDRMVNITLENRNGFAALSKDDLAWYIGQVERHLAAETDPTGRIYWEQMLDHAKFDMIHKNPDFHRDVAKALEVEG